MPLSGCLRFEFLDQRIETVAVFGEIDGVGRGAEDRHARGFERCGELQRRLSAELHDDTPFSAPFCLLGRR